LISRRALAPRSRASGSKPAAEEEAGSQEVEVEDAATAAAVAAAARPKPSRVTRHRATAGRSMFFVVDVMWRRDETVLYTPG